MQSLGTALPPGEGPVAGNVSLQVSEENPRQFYRAWRNYMNEESWDVLADKAPAQKGQGN